MSLPRYYVSNPSAITLAAATGQVVVWTPQFNKTGGGGDELGISSQFSQDLTLFYVKNGGANSLTAQVYGLMTKPTTAALVLTDGVPLLASPQTVANGVTGAITLVDGAQAWPWYALYLVSASGATPVTVQAFVKSGNP